MSRFVLLAIATLLASFTPSSPSHAAIAIDLGFVDRQSEPYRRFIAWVDAALAGEPGYSFSATDAAYAWRLGGEPAHAALAVEWVERQVADAERAIAAGQRPEVAADSYLQAGPMIRDVALVLDWCPDAVTASQRERWRRYASQAVWNIWNPEQAHWDGTPQPWSGWGTDDPANNYHYSFIEATMYWALATDDAGWLQLLEEEKWPALVAAVGAIAGGGSQEGTAYGLSHRKLFELYRVWRDARPGHPDLANANAHLADSIDWWIHATVPTRDRTAAIGDQARVSEPVLYDYHRALMLQARALAHDDAARSAASWWLHAIVNPSMQSGFNLREDLLDAGDGGAPPASLIHHAPGTGQLFARTDWSIDATWLQFSAGPYLQSHAHQDQGAFTLYRGAWLAVTENIWTRSGIRQQTDGHNLVRFEQDGMLVPQREGTTSLLEVVPGSGGDVRAVADLTPAYAGATAVQYWHRTLDFSAGRLRIEDRFGLGDGARAVFQLNTPERPVVEGHRALAGALRIEVVEPANAQLEVVDWTLRNGSDEETYLGGWRLDIGGSSERYVVELTTGEPSPRPVAGCGGDARRPACRLRTPPDAPAARIR
ncbi:MAG TPA: heparinase II/III family protein [Dokdonella sp.]